MKPAETGNAPVRVMTTAELAEHARAARRIGIDTEFVSESRYRALLGLVQVVVATEEGQHIELLDPLAGFDHEPLAAAWADPEVEVVIHSGAQDVAILRRAWGEARAGAREPAEGRETPAESEDRPVGAVLPDVALVEIAKRQPSTLQELERIRGIRPDTGRRRGKQIVEVVAYGRDADPPPAEDLP